MATHSFLWHDYETFGTDPRKDRPAQFAALRTTAELEEIGEPMMWYCQPSDDYLPDPAACLITGITPQHCLQHGLREAEFAARIEAAFAQPGTIGVGYNTLRFDDEVTRFLLWRNLIDPYAREWQNQCGRWDILDMMRTAYALRPEGLVWPQNEQGQISFRLEHLCAANGLQHDQAHDALSDVRATIALARTLRCMQPRLFDFCLALHRKERVAQEIRVPLLDQPFLHISGMFPTERGCLAIMWPLGLHPTNKNEVIAWNLEADPRELLELDPATVRRRLFSKKDALAEGETRLPVKTIHLNKSPVVINQLRTLSAARAAALGIDLDRIEQHRIFAEQLCAQHRPQLAALWQDVYQRTEPDAPAIAEEALYSGFLSGADRKQLDMLRQLDASGLARCAPQFQDARLAALFERYRARNFPECLDPENRHDWDLWRKRRLLHGADGSRSLPDFFDQIDALSERADTRQEDILGALYEYAESIAPVAD